jgi:hypothetical protein
MKRGPFLLIEADGLVGRHLSIALPAVDTVRTYRTDPPCGPHRTGDAVREMAA